MRVVLVEPSHPGNIGGTARAMKTMGLSELYVVAPKRYPDPQADWRAAGALDVLDAARVVADVDEALADCHFIVGTSTRNRKIPWPISDARGVAQSVVEQLSAATQSRAAIMFGREDNGLANDELQRCHLHLQIPASPVYPSLNLAMAVQVVCYEIFQAIQTQDANGPEVASGEMVDQKWDRAWATSAQTEAMLDHMQQSLQEVGFLEADNPGQTVTRLRRLFARARLDETEVQILRGVFKHIGQLRAQATSTSNSGPK